jgi:hypothetical protein
MYIPGAFLGASPVMPPLDRYLATALKRMLKRGVGCNLDYVCTRYHFAACYYIQGCSSSSSRAIYPVSQSPVPQLCGYLSTVCCRQANLKVTLNG